MLNLLGIFYGIGALCIPLLAAVIAGHFAIGPQLLTCAGFAGACALLFLAMHFPASSAPQSFSWREALRVAQYPGVLVLGFLLFCQSGNEASISGWTSTYVGAAGLGARTATLILAGYWAALMAGRLAVSGLLKVVGKLQLVLASGVGALIGAVILLTNRSEAMLVAGTVFGLLFAIALVGGMSFPWAVGQISQRFGVRIGMVVPLAAAVGICVLAWRILKSEKSIEVASQGERGY